jgi:two-component system NtrC family sensor kinase
VNTFAMSRLSIPTRIFAGIVFVLVSFGVVAVSSIRQHQRSAETLRLLGEGYLPLAFDLAEARATQGVVSTLVDRLLEESDVGSTRGWLANARRTRPLALRRLLADVARVERLLGSDEERASFRVVRAEIERIGRFHEENETRFDELMRVHAAGDRASAERILGQMRGREHSIERSMRRVSERMQLEIVEMGKSAKESEERSIALLLVLTLLAIFMGTLVSLFARRLLAPLTTLKERVVALARGERTERIEAERDDEIGRLTVEFERMVDAIDARDIALRDAAEEELRTKERLIQSERFAAIGRMAAHVTHEVRNPLSSIGLNVELLEEETASSGAEVKALLRSIHREVDRLTGITEEYLRLARLPSPRRLEVDVSEVVAEVASFLAAEMQAAGVSLVTRGVSAPTWFPLDESQLRQALLNLLRNAREALSETGGGVVEVSVELDENVLGIEVADDGPGIPDELHARLFEPFHTTKSGGTGLGLALTQQIVEAHGGRILCSPRSPRGTVFRLEFPVRTLD